MASVRRVGPDLPSGVRRPDRSVSLRDVNELPVQRAGPIWFYGGYGNPPQKQAGPDMWVGSEDYPELAGAVEKTAAAEGKTVDPDNPEEVMKWLGNKPTWVEIQPDGTVVEVPEPDPEAWVPDPEAAAPESDPMPDVQPDPGSRPLLSQGLTADQAFQQHMAMSGSGQEHLPGMKPRPSWSPTDEQRAAGKEWIPKVRKTLAGTQPPETEDDLNPQSQRSQQLLADLFAQQQRTRSQQSQQGYFGGLGKAVGGMSTEQKIALALLAGAVTGGMSTPMMVPALGLGAGLAIR